MYLSSIIFFRYVVVFSCYFVCKDTINFLMAKYYYIRINVEIVFKDDYRYYSVVPI